MPDLDLLVFFLGPPLISIDGNKPGYCKLVTSEGSIFKSKRQAKDSKNPPFFSGQLGSWYSYFRSVRYVSNKGENNFLFHFDSLSHNKDFKNQFVSREPS